MFKKFFKISIPVAILAFLVWTIIKQWASIKNQITGADPFLLIIAVLVLILTHLGGAYFWHRILYALSIRVPLKESFRAFIISNFGRFIPGIALHYLARIYLAKGLGIEKKKAASSVFLEAYYTLVGALVISVLALPTLMQFLISTRFSFPVIFFQVLTILALTVGLFLIVFIPPTKVFLIAAKIPFLGKHLPLPYFEKGFLEHLLLIFISSLLFFANGIAFYFLSSAFVPNPFLRLFELSGLFSATWIIGFLTPIAPGGLGVSDLSFAIALSSLYNLSLASFLAILFRFGLLLSEGLVFILVVTLSGFDIINPKLKS